MIDYIVGFLDDEYEYVSNMTRNLEKHEVKLVILDSVNDVSEIELLMDHILDKRINCLFVDYDLMALKSKRYGTMVIKDMLNILPQFPCFLVTNYGDTGEGEKIVPKAQIYDKEVFLEDYNSEDFFGFISNVKNQIECFEKSLQVSLDEYEELYKKRETVTLSRFEIGKLKSLYRILSSYQYIDIVPESIFEDGSKEDLIEAVALLSEIDAKLGSM